MNYYVNEKKDSYSICFLVSKIQRKELEQAYFEGLDPKDIIVIEAYKSPKKKKTPVSEMKEFIQDLKTELLALNVQYLCICNADYYKVFTKEPKTDVNLGYIKEIDGLKVIYVPDYKSIFYDPDRVKNKINRSLTALKNSLAGTYKDPGNINIKGQYPKNYWAIAHALKNLLQYDALTCDIETFSLKPDKAGIGSIAFAWNQSTGLAFQVDPSPNEKAEAIRSLLRWFFEAYQGKLIFHNIAFDASVLIYQLFMDDISDTKGFLAGMERVLNNFEDTKLIAYLATNSCAGNELGLKVLAQEFTGNYAQDEIADITKIPVRQLLEYNLTDCVSTWFVYNKYRPIMVQDQQEKIYNQLFLPSTIDIIQMQLTGIPLNMKRVLEVEKILQADQEQALTSLKECACIKKAEAVLNQEWVDKRNSELKVKRVTLEDANCEFNPRSGKQLQLLLYEVLKLPVLEKTPSGAPATDGDTLKALMNHTQDEEALKVLQSLLDFAAVDKILTAFIPAFKEAVYSKWDHWHYLIGNFNLGGTVSGRLSSSKPNLQQLPATGSKYAKIIKSCFQAPEGWLFCGLDYNALEDHISALTTKDPNKLKVYTDHYDGHCLRAFSYWKDKMPDIVQSLKEHPEKEVEIINSIKQSHKDLRQRSKGCTFALTYQGTWMTLKKNFGFTEEEAKHIEKQYHELYKVSDQWVQKHLDQASIDGYVTAAFGLRVRTPLLKQVIRQTKYTPHEAEAEGRTAGNALGQSWCLLNNRAGVEFNNEVRYSPYRFKIRPVAQIHDAQYFLIKDDPEVILWANEHLVKAVSWQDDPAIYHPEVKLGGEFSIFYPDWAHELVLPNNLKSEAKLTKLVKDYLKSLNQ